MPHDKIKFYTLTNIESSNHYKKLSAEQQVALKVVGHVLPFRVNNYVLDNLIDWSNIPEDAIYQLTFMQKNMLSDQQFSEVEAALYGGSYSKSDLAQVISKVRGQLNPHPAGQLDNVPKLDNEVVSGVQHKYEQTVLIFPAAGQLCHSYCTFCFRWPQFIGDADLKFATDRDLKYLQYLKEHKEVTDVLFTGGDPMVMNVKMLKSYIKPLLSKEFEHIKNIRIGSKSLSYWPGRYVTDPDSEELLAFFKEINESGKRLAFMAHINHPNEMQTDIFKTAVRNIQETGTIIRSQAPLLRHINDNASLWTRMWNEQVTMGIVPYYMFIERDTGPKEYFSVPLHESFAIYKKAISGVSGLARTARGPSMSAFPGKVSIEGIDTINGEKVFILNLLQARKSHFIKRPFFAKYDEAATWLTDLVPAFNQEKFFFE